MNIKNEWQTTACFQQQVGDPGTDGSAHHPLIASHYIAF
jgi:hypothetical protein